MKNFIQRIIFSFLLFLVTFSQVSAQANTLDASQWITYGIVAVIALVSLLFIVRMADSFLAVEARQLGIDAEKQNISVFPSLDEIVKPKVASYLTGQEVKVLRKGHDILLEGEAEGAVQQVNIRTFAIQPQDFLGMSPIPKVVVEEGQKIKAGDILFFDKRHPEVKYVVPVSGEVAAVRRGEKRMIAEIIILADEIIEFAELEAFDLERASREELINYLLETGAWSMIRQRPFDIVAPANVVPRDIFISTFDTAPLAPDADKVVQGRHTAFQKGLDVLTKLTDGKVYLGLDGRGKEKPSPAFMLAEGVEKVFFKGKHPAGNVGVQIHHIKPINVGEIVWTLGVQEVITLGAIFTEGRFNAERVVALTGAELKTPQYVRTYVGANIGELLKDNLANDHVRIVSGDVLSGKQVAPQQFLHFFDDQVTVIEEGDDYELFGWLLPLSPRPSISNTYPNFLFPDQRFKANTNTHGEKRAFVVTSDYEQVMPMDIMVQPLMKAILAHDIERMEGLGILELTEEDVALCEFACTSKMPLQKILRDGLNEMLEG